MNTLVTDPKCPNCGKPMPAGPLAGLCPACLLAQGAEAPSGAGAKPAFVPPSLDEVRRLFPQLEIVSLLGAGGMGAVYKARQPVLDRWVALKVLPSENAGGVNFTERFNREARALARLNHPNIVSVHEFGQAGALHYFIMEFVDGTNLRQLEQASRLSAREALQIIPQICDALQYAHDEGVVHRDIKPENVLIDRKGRVKIADFGLAKIVGQAPDAHRLTVEGQVMGTPHYMAPEQVEHPLEVDHRADIYALGVVFYEMLTGDLPLGKFPPPSFRGRGMQIDVRLDDVVLRALENDPERRYQRAGEVKTEVETIAGTTPPPSSQAPRATPEAQPHFIRWADFPVVAERAGVRRINWKSSLAAFALLFGLLTILFAFSTALTGRSVVGLVGIVGWPSVVFRLILAGVIVGLGVRAALKQPPGPGGTIVANRSRPWWRNGRIIAASVVLLALTAFVFRDSPLRVNARRPGASLAGSAPQIAVRNENTGALVARLPGRGTLELLAISDENAEPNAWWTPDGAAIPDTLYELLLAGGMSHTDRTNRDMIVRWRDLPSGASGPLVEFADGSGYHGGGEVIRNGKLLDRAWPLRASVLPTATTTTLRLGFGLKSWRTVWTHDHNRNRTVSGAGIDTPNVRSQVHQISENAGDAQITMLLEHESRDWNVRVIAVDTNGVEHSHVRGSGTPIEKTAIWTYSYRNLPLAQVKEFRVQTRPVHWVEFRNIALQPRDRSALGRSTRKFVPTMISAAKEVHVTELFDFDKGTSGEFPTAPDGSRFYHGIERNPAWMLKQGFDADAGTNELRLLHMSIIDLANEDFDTITSRELAEQLRSRTYGPSRLPSAPNATLPVTHGFRTAGHTMGLLQIVAFAENKTGATLRYRVIEGAHFE